MGSASQSAHYRAYNDSTCRLNADCQSANKRLKERKLLGHLLFTSSTFVKDFILFQSNFLCPFYFHYFVEMKIITFF